MIIPPELHIEIVNHLASNNNEKYCDVYTSEILQSDDKYIEGLYQSHSGRSDLLHLMQIIAGYTLQ